MNELRLAAKLEHHDSHLWSHHTSLLLLRAAPLRSGATLVLHAELVTIFA